MQESNLQTFLEQLTKLSQETGVYIPTNTKLLTDQKHQDQIKGYNSIDTVKYYGAIDTCGPFLQHIKK